MVFKNPMIARGYLNTMFVLVMSLILQITLTSLGAYFLSRRNVMFQKPIMLLITFTMFFSGGMIPTYLNMKSLHLTGSLWGLILPFMISVYNLIILKTSFASIPESLIEAARTRRRKPSEGAVLHCAAVVQGNSGCYGAVLWCRCVERLVLGVCYPA